MRDGMGGQGGGVAHYQVVLVARQGAFRLLCDMQGCCHHRALS